MLLNPIALLATALLSSAVAQGSPTTSPSTTGPSSTTASSTGSSTGSSTSSAPGATHTVLVGVEGYNFVPNQLTANVGDIIEYRFYPLNHSVARAGFGNQLPCIPYEDDGPPNLVGFWSGFQPVAAVLSNPPIFRLPINDTQPVFFYCSAPGACQQGMIGVINPNSTFTFAAQLTYALNTTESFSPLQYYPPEVAITRTTTATGATSTPTPVSASSSPPASTSPAATASSSSGLSTGAIVGIAIAGVFVFILAAALIYMCGRQKTMGEILRYHQPAPQTYQPTSPGLSEVQYPNNLQKQRITSDIMSGHNAYGGAPGSYGTEADESYRSASPPIDERTGMMSVMAPGNFTGTGRSVPGSPGSNSNGQPFPSPLYSPNPQEMDQVVGPGGLRPINPNEHINGGQGPHELAVPSRNPSSAGDLNSTRPFSFTNSESGYRADEKIDSALQ